MQDTVEELLVPDVDEAGAAGTWWTTGESGLGKSRDGALVATHGSQNKLAQILVVGSQVGNVKNFSLILSISFLSEEDTKMSTRMCGGDRKR